jgi:predicted flap endonuclease-1-like 5' DNA nuclease
MADLMQISGVGKQYVELLEAAGVNTIEELCSRDAEHLFAKFEETNASRNFAKTTPAAKVVQGWIDQAKSMPAKITY